MASVRRVTGASPNRASQTRLRKNSETSKG